MSKIRSCFWIFITYIFLCSFDIFDVTPKDNPNSIIEEPDVFYSIESENINFKKTAKLVVLNKITANSREFEIDTGSSITYGKAEVKLEKCIAKKDTKEYMVLLSLTEKHSLEEESLIFRGWLFSNNPSLSSVEHPVYQIFAISCS